MGETTGDAPTAPKAKPTILVPQRGLLFANGSGPGFSPGPMTLVSSLFPDQNPFSFSQLLAGAMASPLAAAQPQPQLSPLFMVPPGLNPNPTGLLNLSPLQSPFGMSHQQALAHVTAQAALSQSFKQMQADTSRHQATNPTSRHQATNPSPSEPEPLKLESISEISQSDKKPDDKPASDGYNWRKCGQKHVRASECPQSYYKCTHLNCPVKKKAERTLDGRISEITYKGEHNHDLPKHNKRGKDSCTLDTENMASQVWIETDRLKQGPNVRSESENFQTTTKTVFEHHPDISNNYDEDKAIIVHEGDEDEPIAKGRSLDMGPSVPASASSHQAVSESKIVLQTRSEVDLLDDGYKWRKYGQKVVKRNPHPRSYYRCTYPGCNVRKHVERASADPKAIITTYEGTHNHDIPTGRHSSHGGASSSAQKIKTQKTVSKHPSLNKEIDYGDKECIPMTPQLKEGQIVA